MAQMVNWERQLHGFHKDQVNLIWNMERKDEASNFRMMSDLTIGILGVGIIGRKGEERERGYLHDMSFS